MVSMPDLKHIGPYLPGPWWPVRHAVVAEAKRCWQPGDIVLRLGNAYIYGVFWLSRRMAAITGSKYSHAALVLAVKPEVLLLDVNPSGVHRLFLIDWIDGVAGDSIKVLRYRGHSAQGAKVTVAKALRAASELAAADL